VSEAELFAAYRHLAGFSAQCGCGTWIDAPNDEEAVAAAVHIHNESTEHRQWWAEQEAVFALRRTATHPCPCHDHGAAM
jgi:hypothetical protein